MSFISRIRGIVTPIVSEGSQGPKGDKGDAGAKGDQGERGPAGADVAAGNTNVYTCKGSAQITNSSNATPSDITGLSFSLTANRRYYFRFMVTFQTVATTTGIAFLFSAPAMTYSWFRIENQQGAAGVDQMYQNTNGTLTNVLVSASVAAANTNYLAVIEGYCEPSADGTLQLRTRSEVNASQVTVQNGGIGILVDAG